MAHDTFDWQFYTTFYPDVADMSERAARMHFLRAGQAEGRVSSAMELARRVEETQRRMRMEWEMYPIDDGGSDRLEKRIHILIRTCLRPISFDRCMRSIQSQRHTNWRVTVAYDHPDSLVYLQPWLDREERCNAISVNMDRVSREKYRFNLYNNVLLDQVQEGFVMFLDDDDCLAHDKSLSILNDHLDDEKKMVLWNFARPDKVICPRGAPAIRFGEIDTACACFHHSLKRYARWPDRQGGDFAFYSQLMKNTSPWMQYSYVRKILTRTQFTDRMASFGHRGEVEEKKEE